VPEDLVGTGSSAEPGGFKKAGILVGKREWYRIRLRGAHSWEGTAFPPDRKREDPRAEASRIETEEQLSELLVEGWTIVGVVATRPLHLFQNRVGILWQEAFNVFLERELRDEVYLPEQ